MAVLGRERVLLASVMDATDVMLVYLDRDFNFVWVNQAYAETCRMTPESMLGKNHFVLYPHAENETIFRLVRDTGQPVFYKDKPFEFPDQPEREVTYWDWSLVADKDDNGQVIGLVFSLRETTSHVLALRAMRDGEICFRQMFERNDAVMLLVNPGSGNIEDANAAAGLFYGHPVAHLRKMRIEEINALPQTEIAGELARAAGEKSNYFIVPQRLASGELRTVEVHASPFDAEGRTLLLLVIHDITQRKLTEDALRENQQKLKLFIECAPAGIAMFDKEMRYLAVSRRFMEDYGIIGDVIGRGHYEIFPEIPERWREVLRRCLAGETLRCDEDSLLRPDGSVRWGRWEVRPWHSASGEIGGIILFTEDITERVQIKQALVDMNNKLLKEVDKRTEELAALTAHIQNISEMEKASLARELHDELGSILAGISMHIGLVKGKISDRDILDDFALIRDLLSQAARFTRGVVNQLYPTLLDRAGLTDAIQWQVSEYIKHTGIDVELALPEQQVNAEHAYMLATYRILQECLTNIAKHARASKVRIDMKIGSGWLELIISDNGMGLPAALNNEGHGILGMRERARHLGGSMELFGREGEGTTARLILPLASMPKGRKCRVLVVDDHEIIRDGIRSLLEDHTDEFSVGGEAGDGELAIRMAIAEEWDVVLLDIFLPKKNGLEVLEKIKAEKPDLPVIMLSSHSENEFGGIATLKGAACYVEKGETSKLVEMMRRVVSRQQS